MGTPAQNAARKVVVDTWQMPPPRPFSVESPIITRPSAQPASGPTSPITWLKEKVAPSGMIVPLSFLAMSLILNTRLLAEPVKLDTPSEISCGCGTAVSQPEPARFLLTY